MDTPDNKRVRKIVTGIVALITGALSLFAFARFGLVGAFVVFLAFLVTLIALFGRAALVEDGASRRWPRTYGVVTEAWIDRRSVYPAGPSAYASQIRYTYTIDGQTYVGERIGLAQRYASQDYAQNTINRLRPGTRVDLSYNPDNPAASLLELSGDPSPTVTRVLMVVVIILVSAFFIFLWQRL